ncbi:MAG: low molecular weight phosphotyrosine protein phosphatase [Fibrobacter sp.]|jgi:protein-tyrosine phosphatase|nr:low molecular weight phosphotyrosine protein phosphatase [Fibrobacter sp.]
MIKKKVLFVCLGNICRSPTAEGIARVLAKKSDIEFDSAGLGSWHIGKPPHLTTQKVAQEKGFPIDDLRARKVSPSDFSEFDYIVAMDKSNFEELAEIQKKHPGKAKLRMLLPNNESVPDPYYGEKDGFYETFEIIHSGLEAFLKEML